jgi:hypothetical protein
MLAEKKKNVKRKLWKPRKYFGANWQNAQNSCARRLHFDPV